MFLLLLQHCEVAKVKKRFFLNFNNKNVSWLPAQCATTFYSLGIYAILLANTGKLLKYRFERVQNLVSF